jgi:hypothetical protein
MLWHYIKRGPFAIAKFSDNLSLGDQHISYNIIHHFIISVFCLNIVPSVGVGIGPESMVACHNKSSLLKRRR